MPARVTNQKNVIVGPHTSVGGNTWIPTREGEADGDGAAGGTTLVDSKVGGSDDDFNGRYYIECLSGANKGLRRRVVDYTASSGTFTLENNGFPNQCLTGIEYRLLQSPEPVVVIDSSSGETNAVDAVRAEANGFWNGYYLIPITGTHRGKMVAITDFTSSTGTFTLAAGFGSALTAGDVCRIAYPLEVVEVPALTQGYYPRPAPRVNLSVGDGVVGERGGSYSFSTHVRPSGSLAGDDTLAAPPYVRPLLQACGLVEEIGTGSAAGSGSTTTAIKIETANRERFYVGQMILHNGNRAWIDSMADGGASEDTLNVTPALPVAPASGETIYATTQYRKSTDLDLYGCWIEVEVDGVRKLMTGCMGSVSVPDSNPLMLQFEMQIDEWVKVIEAAPYNAGSSYATTAAPLMTDRLAYLDSTGVDIGGFTAFTGTVASPKDVSGVNGTNGRAGFQLTDYAMGATFREILDSSGNLDQLLRWTARTSKKVSVVWGHHGNSFAVRIPAGMPIEMPEEVDSNGMQAAPNVLEAQDAGTASDGGSTVKNPDFALHFA